MSRSSRSNIRQRAPGLPAPAAQAPGKPCSMDVPSASGTGCVRRARPAAAERKYVPRAKCFGGDISAWQDRSPQHNRAGKDFA
ncbi:hypothetical protein ACVWW1_003848 [Bradyrhizobium sp. JR3.5]